MLQTLSRATATYGFLAEAEAPRTGARPVSSNACQTWHPFCEWTGDRLETIHGNGFDAVKGRLPRRSLQGQRQPPSRPRHSLDAGAARPSVEQPLTAPRRAARCGFAQWTGNRCCQESFCSRRTGVLLLGAALLGPFAALFPLLGAALRLHLRRGVRDLAALGIVERQARRGGCPCRCWSSSERGPSWRSPSFTTAFLSGASGTDWERHPAGRLRPSRPAGSPRFRSAGRRGRAGLKTTSGSWWEEERR